ncbi:MAG: hypothetical protein IPM50_10430 [Acidobacteriota bacterium]|nr:MAG: hypothetical protein IPM50_10430 [Acidobacteriota bacterium]
MWRIQNPIIRRTKLDFTSSEQGFREVSQLVFDGVVLLNAIELTDWEADGTQLIICDRCGFTHCETGGWANVRKAGDYVFVLPAFNLLESGSNSDEYAPPPYIRKFGVPYFSVTQYGELVATKLGFPEYDTILPMEMRDAVRIVQLETPYRIFGEPPTVDLKPDKKALAIASSEGEPHEHLRNIEILLKVHYDDRRSAQLRPMTVDEKIISIFLDADVFIDWKPLAKGPKGWLLTLEDNFVIEPISSHEDSPSVQ